jgi:hypothetical protein
MALRFLADHCVSNTVVRTLRDATHEVLRLKDVLPLPTDEFQRHRDAANAASGPGHPH